MLGSHCVNWYKNVCPHYINEDTLTKSRYKSIQNYHTYVLTNFLKKVINTLNHVIEPLKQEYVCTINATGSTTLYNQFTMINLPNLYTIYNLIYENT